MNVSRTVERLTVVLAALSCIVFLVGIPGSVHLGSGLHGSPTSVDVPLPAEDAVLPMRVRAAVTLAPIGGASARVFLSRDGEYPLVAEGRTDSAGRLTLTGLPRGVAWVLVEAPGRARQSVQRMLSGEPREAVFDLAEANHFTVRVENERHEPIPGATVLVNGSDPLPFGALTNEQGRAVFDRVGTAPWRVKAACKGYETTTRGDVTADLTITLQTLSALAVAVRDTDDKPVPGATIWIAGPMLFPARRVETDDKGRALISGLEAGAYELKARRDERVSQTEVGVPVRRGERNEITLILLPGRFVAIRVTDGTDNPPIVVRNADVVLTESGLSAFPLQGRTNTFGEVTLGPIAPGPAVVGARADGFVPRAAVAVAEDLGEPVRVPLLRGAVLRGTVVDADGQGVDGATVEILGTDLDGLPIAETPMMMAYRDFHFEWSLGGPAPLMPAGELGVMPGPIPPIPGSGARAAALAEHMAVATDPWVTRRDGSFSARPVTPGRVRALVRHPEFVAGLSEAVTLGPGGEASVRVVLGRGGSVEGRVVDEAGIPVAGARVDVRAIAGTLERTTLTETDGAFAFAAIPRDSEVLLARPDDLSRIVWRSPLEVPEGERIELELVLPDARQPMIVKVTGSDGAPVEMAQVTALSLDPRVPLRETRFTDEEGVAEVPDAAGLELSLVVEASSHAPFERTHASAPEEVEVVLETGVIVEGDVTAVRGRRAVADADVTLITGGRRLMTQTDGEGHFRFEAVQAGRARVVVEHPDFADEERDVVIQKPSRTDRAFEIGPFDLEEAGSIAGRVIDANGNPVSGARVAVGLVPAYLPMGALPADMAKTGGDGDFTLDNVPPGTVDVEAYAVDAGRGRARGIAVEAGRETAGVTIALAPSAQDLDPATTGTVAVTLGERGAGDDGEVVIVHVAPRSEAERAGLEAGDVLLAVDDVDVLTLGDARQRLSGGEGSDVLVDVARGAEELRLRVRRERVRR